MTRIAINGLGRIGKLLLREFAVHGLLEQVVLLGDRMGDADQHALLVEFDTIHGRFDGAVRVDRDVEPAIPSLAGCPHLSIQGHAMPLCLGGGAEDLPLRELNVDLVIDCSGAYRTAEALSVFKQAGVERVLVSAPMPADDALNVVFGINHHDYDPERHRWVSASSCTTQCLAPVVKVLSESFGIRHGSFTTLHDVTNTQELVDRPAKDARRSRSALNSLIPTTTGSATAIGRIFPELQGRLDGHAVRVPVLNASLTDMAFEVDRAVTAEEVNTALETAADGQLQGILGYETRPLVSSDFLNDPRSSVIDALSTRVVNQTHVKLYAWYDNEWGYTRRLGDLARWMVEHNSAS